MSNAYNISETIVALIAIVLLIISVIIFFTSSNKTLVTVAIWIFVISIIMLSAALCINMLRLYPISDEKVKNEKMDIESENE